MQKALFTIAALLLAVPASADPSGVYKPGKSQAPAEPLPLNKTLPLDKTLPLKGATSRGSCAAFGPGFVKVEGSDTCVKLGGAISVGAGGSR
jgi:hypothetical protein